jgi:hypothetical protein
VSRTTSGSRPAPPGRRLRRLIGAIATGTLLAGVAAGCGGLDEQEQKAADSMSRAFQDEGLTAKDADCVAEEWVDDAGVEQLRDEGVLTKGNTFNTKNTKRPHRDVLEPYVDSYFDCVDYGKYEAIQYDKRRPDIIDKAQFADCADKIDEDDAQQAMLDELLGKESKTRTSVEHQLIQCVTGG